MSAANVIDNGDSLAVVASIFVSFIVNIKVCEWCKQ
jgi:hypothetical protein